jgi:hypothetical protein
VITCAKEDEGGDGNGDGGDSFPDGGRHDGRSSQDIREFVGSRVVGRSELC